MAQSVAWWNNKMVKCQITHLQGIDSGLLNNQDAVISIV